MQDIEYIKNHYAKMDDVRIVKIAQEDSKKLIEEVKEILINDDKKKKSRRQNN